jgi:hypothetical protein
MMSYLLVYPATRYRGAEERLGFPTFIRHQAVEQWFDFALLSDVIHVSISSIFG